MSQFGAFCKSAPTPKTRRHTTTTPTTRNNNHRLRELSTGRLFATEESIQGPRTRSPIADSELSPQSSRPSLAAPCAYHLIHTPSTPAKFMPALSRIIGAFLIYLLALSAVSAGNTAPLAARPSPTHPPTSAPAVSSQQHTNLTNTSAHYRHRASRYYCPLALLGPTPPHSAPCPTPTRLTQPPLCPRANTSQTTPGNTFYIIVRQHNSSTPYPPTLPPLR